MVFLPISASNKNFNPHPVELDNKPNEIFFVKKLKKNF
jgi:hypothetical protein